MNSVWKLIIYCLLFWSVALHGCVSRITTELNAGNKPDKVSKKQLDKYLKDAKGKRPTSLMKHLPKSYYR